VGSLGTLALPSGPMTSALVSSLMTLALVFGCGGTLALASSWDTSALTWSLVTLALALAASSWALDVVDGTDAPTLLLGTPALNRVDGTLADPSGPTLVALVFCPVTLALVGVLLTVALDVSDGTAALVRTGTVTWALAAASGTVALDVGTVMLALQSKLTTLALVGSAISGGRAAAVPVPANSSSSDIGRP
jgi:hypothetical protein